MFLFITFSYKTTCSYFSCVVQKVQCQVIFSYLDMRPWKVRTCFIWKYKIIINNSDAIYLNITDKNLSVVFHVVQIEQEESTVFSFHICLDQKTKKIFFMKQQTEYFFIQKILKQLQNSRTCWLNVFWVFKDQHVIIFQEIQNEYLCYCVMNITAYQSEQSAAFTFTNQNRNLNFDIRSSDLHRLQQTSWITDRNINWTLLQKPEETPEHFRFLLSHFMVN